MKNTNKTDTYTPWKLWFEFIKKNKKTYFIGVFCVLICNISQVIQPRLFGELIDFLKSGKSSSFFYNSEPKSTLISILTAILICFFLLFLARIGWRVFLARPTHIAGAYLREKIWEHARYLSFDNLQKNFPIGHLMNLSTSDVNSAKFVYGFTLIGAFDCIFLTILMLTMMIQIDLELTIYTVLIISALPYLIKKLSTIELKRYEVSQKFLGILNDLCSQSISTIRLQRLTQTHSYWTKRLEASANDFRLKKNRQIESNLFFYPMMGLATILSYVVLFIIGLNKVLNNEMSVGEFATMQSYVFLLQDPLFEMGFIVSECQRARTSLNRLAELYNQKVDTSLSIFNNSKFNFINTNIFIKNLDFYYKDQLILKKFNLNFNKNILGITGEIGSGKTTLAKILTKQLKDFSGTIEIAGKNIESIDHHQISNLFSLVHQKPFLFASSIKDNICLDKNLSDQEIWDLLELSGLKSDVEGFTDGIYTQLGEWGINLSGGQQQRLTIARALARKTPYIILDDSLSAVDNKTEKLILENLKYKLKDTKIILIAHRKSTLSYCDEVINLKKEVYDE